MKNSLFPVVILAGGLATRLRPITEKIPKAMVDVLGEPFIAHQLRLLKKNNIAEVVLCLGYLGEQVEHFVGNGNQFGLNVQYAFDGTKLLGTAGAIKKALPLLSDNFFVMYGDSYLPCDFQAVQEAFIHSHQKALMTVFHNENQWDKSNVEFVHKKIRAYDKLNITPEMRYIDYGLGVLKKTVFDSVPADTVFDLADVYQKLLRENQLAGFEVKERFYEVGSFQGLDEFNKLELK